MATETLRPEADGTATQLNASTGDNWECVDEAVADDGDYVYTNSDADQYDQYVIPDSGIGAGEINSVKVYVRGKYTGVNGWIYAMVNATIGGAQVLTASYANYSQTWATNPGTTDPWTWEEINALQIGVYLNCGAVTTQCFCSQVYVEVDYTPIINVTIEPPLATIDSAGIVPTMSLGRIFAVPLATISSEGLVPAWGLGAIISVPLATIDSAGFVPTFIIDKIFSVPLATISSTGLVPTVRVDRIFSVPLTEIDIEALSPELSIGMGVIVPLATISTVGIAPELYLEFFRAVADFINRRTTVDFTNLRTMTVITNRKVMNVFTNIREWINHTGIRS